MEPTAQTTKGITRQDVDEAMEYLGIFNPKPGIPLETTVSGHEIVATARMFQAIESRLEELGK